MAPKDKATERGQRTVALGAKRALAAATQLEQASAFFWEPRMSHNEHFLNCIWDSGGLRVEGGSQNFLKGGHIGDHTGDYCWGGIGVFTEAHMGASQ